VKIIKCDRCGSQVAEAHAISTISFSAGQTELEMRSQEVIGELCQTCLAILQVWIGQPPKPAVT
jgi:hypothetical protein